MKIALCTPCYSRPEMGFAYNWVQLAVHTAQALGAEVEPFTVSSPHLAENREILTDHALKWGADYILWIDADQIFPRDGLVRLLHGGKAVIAANYPRRGRPTGPTAARIVKGKRELVWTTPELAEAGVIEPVDQIGLGFCLVDAQALKGLRRPLFLGPYEDSHFCKLLRSAGVEIFIDHGLSWEVGHIYTATVTNRDAMADRIEWKMREARGAELHNLPVPHQK